MAADDGEGSSGEKKNDDPFYMQKGKPFSAMHQEIESKLTKTGISYEDKVDVVLSGWDHLAGAASNGQIQFASFLYRWTLQLVLQGEWPKLEKIVKTRLGATLQRCTRDSTLQPLCRNLLPLVSDPWGHPTLKSIFASNFVSVEEAEQYIKTESWEIIKVRVNTLVESRCEELALSFLKVCMRCIRLQSKNEAELSELLYSQEDHNHFFDLYFVLLYKFNKKQFLEEVRQLDLEEGVDHVRRLLAQQEKGKVWKHRLKIAELEIQIFLASIIVKPYENNFWSVFRDWCEVMIAVEVASDLLIQMVQKYLQLSESSQHIYTMASILHQKFGESYNALVIELLIRALTRDMNTLEGIKLEVKESTLEQQTSLEHQMADGFMDLSAVFEQHVTVARECVLTAFSLHPTVDRLQKLKDLAIILPVKREPDKGENDQPILENISDQVSEQTIDEKSSADNLNHHEWHVGQTASRNPTSDKVDKIIKVPIIDTGQTCKEVLNANEINNDISEKNLMISATRKSSQEFDKNIGVEMDNFTNSEVSKKNSYEVEEVKEKCITNNVLKLASSIKNVSESDDVDAKCDSVLISVVSEENKSVASEDTLKCNSVNVTSNLPVNNENFSNNECEKNICSNNFNVDTINTSETTDTCDYDDIRSKEIPLSMDEFLASTEQLIEQLNQEIKEESERIEIKRIIRCDILSAPQAILNGETLGLAKELCDDLAVVLSSPRWQVLSWALDKNELLLKCDKYFVDSDRAKNITKELKFLNIDYSQFKHLPSEEVDEFTGIEKGYEHFMEDESDLDEDYYLGSRGVCNQYSSGSEADCAKRYRGVGRVRGRRGRPPLRGRFLTSDSDSTGRSKSRSVPVTSLSESDDSDFDEFGHYKTDIKNFEGKRITAVSCNDRRKRLKIDATTGQVRQSRGSVSHLRLYRHEATCIIEPPKPFRNRRGRPPKHGGVHSRSFAPSLGSVNLNPSVVLTHYNQSPIKEEVKSLEDTAACNPVKTEASNNLGLPSYKIPNSKPSLLRTPFARGANNIWRYAGYLVSGPEKETNKQSSVSVLPSQHKPQNKCAFRTREGRVVTLNTNRVLNEKEQPSTENSEYEKKLISGHPLTTFQESFKNFVMQKNPETNMEKSSNLTNRKHGSLQSNLEYLKRQGTSVIFKKKSDITASLENAQKNVLSCIMSPENSIPGFHRSNLPLPVRAIAMPVSHNPPNLPPNDKTNPVGLSRVLPKGTTVVRRPKPDSGAGPSGLNNGGSSSSVIHSGRSIPTQQRPTISITPSNSSFLVSSPSSSSFAGNARGNFIRSSIESLRHPETLVNLVEGSGSSIPNTPSTSTENENFSPLAVATVVGSVSQTSNPRSIINISSPGETQGGSFIVRDITLKPSRAVAFSNLGNISRVTAGTTTTTVANLPGETRAPSMLETLLRDRSTPTSPLLLSVSASGSPAPTTTTSSIHEPLVASSSAMTGTSLSAALSEVGNFVTSHASDFESNSNASSLISTASLVGTSGFLDNSGSSIGSVNVSNVRSSPIQGVAGMALLGSGIPSNILTSSFSGNVIVSGVTTQTSAGSNGSAMLSGASGSNSVVSSNAVSDISTSGMHQLLLPAQLIQVQQTDGSTGLSIVHSVHSGSLDLRLPPGTRVIKSPSSSIRQNAPVTISQSNARPLNVLHNLKIVQNRQIVRTVVVPHSVALQSLGAQQTAQLVALSQSPSTSNSGVESQSAPRMSTQMHKMLGHNVVPGGLVIRAVRSSPDVIDDTMLSKPQNPTTIIHHTADNHQKIEKNKEVEKSKAMPPVQSQEEGLAERLSRHYLKTALLASSNTQSVGTQTQTTAVKPVTGQLVNQVVMNHLRGISSSGTVPVVSPITVASSRPSPSPLTLSSSNAVSSETLEQLREFESVFEKVSNKSVKDNEAVVDQESFSTSNVSSEESMIAAQLLSMANETPPVTTASSYVYSVPTSGTENLSTSSSCSSTTASSSTGLVGACLSEGTFITIPCTTQPGTLILVNPSASGIVTMSTASGVQTSHPPPAASPALSSTSSHSSIASSPSSTSSKSKSKTSKTKVSSMPNATVSSKPKSPPPPKVPPKPAVAKPQVEESDETKARIQAILDRYKQDLANTPQPQPAPRNRKNCPPPKNEGKSSSKKKSSAKKLDGGAVASPSTSDSGHLPSVSPSPAPLAMTPSGEDSEGSIGGTSTCSQFQDEKPKTEENISPQILQGVVVSNMKVDGTGLGANITTIPQGLAGGRVVQLIRHGSKVTAITTRQPFQKAKIGLTSGGPPPNVTIQGRINMNDLMESHLATLLAGGSTTINQNSPLITKLIQSQQHQSPTVQQLVVQTSNSQGQQVLQQVSLQSVIAAHAKQQLHVVSCRTNSEPGLPLSNSPLKTSQPHSSPSMSTGGISASPGTPQQRMSSPSTPSPAPDLPQTPSSFPTHEEDSNSSVQSHEGGPAGPLPPFFTLTKQFMLPHQNQQFREKALSGTSTQSSVPASPENMRSASKLINDSLSNRPNSVNSGQVHSFDRSESSFSKNVCMNSGGSKSSKPSIAVNVLFPHSAPSSPLVNSVENVLDMSSVSEPSSLESSPSIISQRLCTLNAASEMRSNSLDSVKSDLSVEEVQIPPSPATLTKQLQNAYMTEAALSPAVSQSQMSSSSSYCSPTTVQDLTFAGTSREHRALSPNLGHPSHTFSLAGTSSNTSSLSNASNCSASNNNHVIDNASLACLSSPSGDVYLDQGGVGLGLDGLPLAEGRPHSPLSDLVPAVPLLSWSPRSADSIMGQSPSMNDALSGNMTLDVHHSEDSLCDSSTGFPGLFSMEGDGASVSSSTSEEMHSNMLSSTGNFTHMQTSTGIGFPSVSSHSQLGDDRHHFHRSVGKKLPNREQDHTISSTRCEGIGSGLALQLGNRHCKINVELAKREESCSSVASEEELWRAGDIDLPIAASSEDNGGNLGISIDYEHSNSKKKGKKFKNANKERREDQGRRRSQRQMEVGGKKNPSDNLDNMAQNGYEDKKIAVKDEEVLPEKTNDALGSHEHEHSSQNIKFEIKDDAQASVSDLGLGPHLAEDSALQEDISIRTRGMKRRSDSDFPQDEKKNKSSRSRRSLIELKQDDEKIPTFEDGTIGPLTRSLRNRHISGTSDSSSNFSMDRVSTPGLQDSPLGSGSSTIRKRRGSHDSSVSSRDSSPMTVHLNAQHDGSATTSSGIHTRRSSSRDHAKKTRCRCCGDQQQSSQGGSSRRTSGRVSRGSGPSNS